MRGRVVRRAFVLATACLLLTAGLAMADTAPALADEVSGSTTRDLGDVAPGAVVNVSLAFELRCKEPQPRRSGADGDPQPGELDRAVGGGSVSATDGAIGPVPATWPADGTFCDFPARLIGVDNDRADRVARVGSAYNTALRMLAQASREYPEAGDALLQLAEAGKIGTPVFVNLASTLGAMEFQLLPVFSGLGTQSKAVMHGTTDAPSTFKRNDGCDGWERSSSNFLSAI